jgi:hypothetical protein
VEATRVREVMLGEEVKVARESARWTIVPKHLWYLEPPRTSWEALICTFRSKYY